LKKKEQEMLKEKMQKGIKRGYKLHIIYDLETKIPLYWIVLPAYFIRMLSGALPSFSSFPGKINAFLTLSSGRKLP
ncbi:MAG: hypothetical protein ACREBF_04760, partial [Candidatus Micrarchaeales archaeon]